MAMATIMDKATKEQYLALVRAFPWSRSITMPIWTRQ